MIRLGFGVEGVVFRDNCHNCCSYTIIMVEGLGLGFRAFQLRVWGSGLAAWAKLRSDAC